MPQKDPDERRKYQREYQRRWRENNPDKVKAYTEREKSEERKEYRRRYYERNREKILQRTKERYADPEIREAKKLAAKKWAEENPERMAVNRRRSWAKLRYGLTLEEVDAILARGCALCGSQKQLHIDHCHTSGKVRAALCRTCNTGLGQFGDDPARLRAAADYLEKHT